MKWVGFCPIVLLLLELSIDVNSIILDDSGPRTTDAKQLSRLYKRLQMEMENEHCFDSIPQFVNIPYTFLKWLRSNKIFLQLHFNLVKASWAEIFFSISGLLTLVKWMITYALVVSLFVFLKLAIYKARDSVMNEIYVQEEIEEDFTQAIHSDEENDATNAA
ncbi:MAG: hypothetical protein MHMPM18_000494 [Marteilia pararefringens]